MLAVESDIALRGGGSKRAQYMLPATCSRRKRAEQPPTWTSSNLVPVAPMRSKASLLSPETINGPAHPSQRNTLAPPTLDLKYLPTISGIPLSWVQS
jgi:hypothetical protein